MILVDTGPLVALFEVQDQHHSRCRRILDGLNDDLVTTAPVLAETFHLLGPGSIGPPRLIKFIQEGGVGILPMDDRNLHRCFDLMLRYADLPMDFADASIVSTAEEVGTRTVFTLDYRHFATYRIRRGYHRIPFTIIGDPSGPGFVREGVAQEEEVEPAHTP
ncbi:MAG: PIN domain-containing protein [Gemmatimonadetes bacterium]|nr:PIN domain-containing protein [Gemmatimonadota bacterium]MYA63996.1 PIN domain-containing protein [Gemmatimonadota bacterium]MYB98497.1 PIN domain-containing protein [Gemmatimonadota bacterium]MYH52674.1 PIN domain-containing protein [Gemmatimonadota bacterium]